MRLPFKKFILSRLVKEVVKEITVSDPDDTIFDGIENKLASAIEKRKLRKANKRRERNER